MTVTKPVIPTAPVDADRTVIDRIVDKVSSKKITDSPRIDRPVTGKPVPVKPKTGSKTPGVMSHLTAEQIAQLSK